MINSTNPLLQKRQANFLRTVQRFIKKNSDYFKGVKLEKLGTVTEESKFLNTYYACYTPGRDAAFIGKLSKDGRRINLVKATHEK